jgi:AGZA family xanthine/uracil permease-like MFS transporter
MPLRIPGGAWAVAFGTAAAWILHGLGEPSPVSAARLDAAQAAVDLYLPVPVIGDLVAGLRHEMTRDFLIPVMLPMGLFNVLGSLQNIESAEAAGDSYPTLPSLAVNGAGSLVAACFGSCFPTTIYIGHPGWKGLGARAGYSILNGLFFVLVATFGLTSLIAAVVPIEAGMAIVLWIGIVITAQAFQATPREHAPAVAVGLFPAIAAWGVLILTMVLTAVDIAESRDLASGVLARPEIFRLAGLDLGGLIAISQGFMLTCLVWSAASAHLIDKKFLAASAWAVAGAAVAFFGFVHAGTLTSTAGATYDIGWAAGWRWSVGYLLCAAFFAVMHLWAGRPRPAADAAPHA